MNLKKTGKIILLITLIVVIILNIVPFDTLQIRLFLGSFGFGSGLVLIAIGNSKKYDL